MRIELLEQGIDGQSAFYGVIVTRDRDYATPRHRTVEDAKRDLHAIAMDLDPSLATARKVQAVTPLNGRRVGGDRTRTIMAFGDDPTEFYVVFDNGGGIQLPTHSSPEQAEGAIAEPTYRKKET